MRRWVLGLIALVVVGASGGFAGRFTMPSTPLPASTATELADLMARVQRLEANQGSLSLLTTLTNSTNDVYNYSSTWVTMPDATPPSFTLVRPTPILLVASLTYFGVGGTAVNLIVSGGISATNVAGNNPNGNDINGNEMYTTDGVLGNDSPPGGVPAPWASLPIGTYTGIRPFLCPAGTWYAHINYKMFGGATTTITNNGSSVDVFQLPG